MTDSHRLLPLHLPLRSWSPLLFHVASTDLVNALGVRLNAQTLEERLATMMHMDRRHLELQCQTSLDRVIVRGFSIVHAKSSWIPVNVSPPPLFYSPCGGFLGPDCMQGLLHARPRRGHHSRLHRRACGDRDAGHHHPQQWRWGDRLYETTGRGVEK